MMMMMMMMMMTMMTYPAYRGDPDRPLFSVHSCSPAVDRVTGAQRILSAEEHDQGKPLQQQMSKWMDGWMDE